VHFVAKACAKVLLDCSDATAQADILTLRRLHGSFECGVNAIGDKVERGLHSFRAMRAGDA
jgi:hypothetical protein